MKAARRRDLRDGTPTKSERQGNNQTPYPNCDTVTEYLV